LETAASKLDIDSMFNLGLIYETGLYGVEKDIEMAFSNYDMGIRFMNGEICPIYIDLPGYIEEESDEWTPYRENALQFFTKHQEIAEGTCYNDIGTCYKHGIGTSADASMALHFYKKALITDDKDTVYRNIYELYTDGICCPQDTQTAIKWLEIGDEDGVAYCTDQLHLCYKNGIGVEKDDDKMLYYLRKYVEMRSTDDVYIELADCYRYAIGTHKDETKAFEWYCKANSFSVAGAKYVGQCYEFGIGVRKNRKKAVEMYRFAAGMNDICGQFYLANCYKNGIGINQDLSKAIEWYRKSAMQGNRYGMYNLAVEYREGNHIKRNYEKAARLFRKVALKGDAWAQCNLGCLFLDGRGVVQSYVKAAKWFRMAAEQGDIKSQYHLGKLYYEGLGVAHDTGVALKWLEKSAEQGYADAQKLLDTIEPF